MRLLLVSASLALLLCACRGSTNEALPAAPTLPGSQQSIAVAAALRFMPIGPTHMTISGLPTSGKVNAFAQDPANPKVLYVASGRGTGLETYSSAGLFRSTNGGASWQPLVNGLTDPSGLVSSTINAVWIDHENPSTVLAASEYDGIFRSTDRGSSWHNVFRTTQATQFAEFDRIVYAATAAGLLRSNDDGASWSVAIDGTTKRHPTAFGATSHALYAGMSDGSILRFLKKGWMTVGKLPYDHSTGTDGSTPAVHQMAVDPTVPTTVYASSNDGAWDQDLHASANGGRTWNTVLKQRYADYGLGTQAIAFSTVHPHTLYIGSDGVLYTIQGNGTANPTAVQAAALTVVDLRNIWTTPNGPDDRCWIAADQGLDNVPACSLPGSVPNDDVVSKTINTGLARHFVLSPDGRTLLTSLQDFSSHLTTTGGGDWDENPNLYEDGFNELRPGNPLICYAYDEASGLSLSTDGCRTFPKNRVNAVPSRLMTEPIAFDPNNPRIMYLASGPIMGIGFPNAPKAVFKTMDGGNTITQLTWPFAAPGCIVVDQRNAGHIIVGDLKGGRSSLAVSFNGGKTWQRSTGVPATPFWYSVSILPTNNKVVLATNVDAANNVYVLRSNDAGRTFTRTAVVTNAPLIRGHIDADRRERRHSDVDADSKRSEPAAFVYSPVREIRFNQQVTQGTADVVVTTLRGAFVSADLGQTWSRLDGGLIAHSFWGARWRNGYLYLASDGQGIVRSTAPVQSP